MGMRYSSGFTIIETVLFLSVTGLLVLGVLIGTGAAINNQRYRDATESFKSILQEQYSAVESVRNGRENTWGCDGAAQTVEDGRTIRGQSDCIIVGRYIKINADTIDAYPVLARQTSDTERANDILSLRQNYNYAVSEVEGNSKKMEWGTEIAWPAQGTGYQAVRTPRTFSMLILRSPESGAVYTFTNTTIPENGAMPSPVALAEMIQAGEVDVPGKSQGQGKRTLCVITNGIIPTGETAVFISAYASGASAIETRSNDLMKSFGETTQC